MSLKQSPLQCSTDVLLSATVTPTKELVKMVLVHDAVSFHLRYQQKTSMIGHFPTSVSHDTVSYM